MMTQLSLQMMMSWGRFKEEFGGLKDIRQSYLLQNVLVVVMSAKIQDLKTDATCTVPSTKQSSYNRTLNSPQVVVRRQGRIG